MSLIEDLITKESMEHAKKVIKVKNECENIKNILLGLGYAKWGTNTRIVVNHTDKIVLLYTKCNAQKNRCFVLQSLIDTANILPGYTLIYGYLKTSKNVGYEQSSCVFNDHNIEIVGGLNLLKRVFGNAYELYLTNCEKYIKSQLSPQLDNARTTDELYVKTPSEVLTSQVNNHINQCAPLT